MSEPSQPEGASTELSAPGVQSRSFASGESAVVAGAGASSDSVLSPDAVKHALATGEGLWKVERSHEYLRTRVEELEARVLAWERWHHAGHNGVPPDQLWQGMGEKPHVQVLEERIRELEQEVERLRAAIP